MRENTRLDSSLQALVFPCRLRRCNGQIGQFALSKSSLRECSHFYASLKRMVEGRTRTHADSLSFREHLNDLERGSVHFTGGGWPPQTMCGEQVQVQRGRVEENRLVHMSSRILSRPPPCHPRCLRYRHRLTAYDGCSEGFDL